MKVNKRGMIIIGLFIVLLFLSSFNVMSTLLSTLLASPWWAYLIIAAIVFSGYMSFKHTKAEYQFEQDYIEKEGDVYMRRLEEEKVRRKNMSS